MNEWPRTLRSQTQRERDIHIWANWRCPSLLVQQRRKGITDVRPPILEVLVPTARTQLWRGLPLCTLGRFAVERVRNVHEDFTTPTGSLENMFCTFANVPRGVLAGDGHKVRQIGDRSHYFYQQLPPNNDLSCFCVETAVFPGLQRTPPADKKCLTEKCSCWHTIDETLIWAWWLSPGA